MFNYALHVQWSSLCNLWCKIIYSKIHTWITINIGQHYIFWGEQWYWTGLITWNRFNRIIIICCSNQKNLTIPMCLMFCTKQKKVYFMFSEWPRVLYPTSELLQYLKGDSQLENAVFMAGNVIMEQIICPCITARHKYQLHATVIVLLFK